MSLCVCINMVYIFVHIIICTYTHAYVRIQMYAHEELTFNMQIHVCLMSVCIYIHIYIYALGSRAAPGGPCSQQSRTTGTNPRKPEGGRTMENDPSQCFFTGAENRIRAGTGAPFARRKEQHHILYGNEHVTMTLLLTSGSNHTISL